MILFGKRSIDDKDRKIYARYESGLEELLDNNLIRGISITGEGEVFELPHKGWELAEPHKKTD